MTTLRDCACFASGIGAGMAIAMLIAPKTGADMRSEIRNKVQEGARALKRGKASAREAVDREVEGLGEAYEAGKRAYKETVSRGYEQGTPQHAG